MDRAWLRRGVSLARSPGKPTRESQMLRISRSWTVVACALVFGACDLDDTDDTDDTGAPEDLDPAGTLGEEELFDEGPLPADIASDSPEVPYEVLIAPRFQLPFPCGQVWAGQTRTNHSPVSSIDFNRTNDLGDTVVAAA